MHRRGVSDQQVDEYVKQQAMARDDARVKDRQEHPEQWELVTDEFSDVFGPAWRERKD